MKIRQNSTILENDENGEKMDKIDKLAQNRQNGKNDEIRQTTFIAPSPFMAKKVIETAIL